MPHMKYHYQLVSKTKVRIELIPEDKKEIGIFESFGENENNDQLTEYFRVGLAAYNNEATLARINFMQFPKVALCSFETIKKTEPSLI
jgi:hypothetical protein